MVSKKVFGEFNDEFNGKIIRALSDPNYLLVYYFKTMNIN